jgi:hypothetical protein
MHMFLKNNYITIFFTTIALKLLNKNFFDLFVNYRNILRNTVHTYIFQLKLFQLKTIFTNWLLHS